jgi:uncharacterized protein (TIGR03083 family)
VNHLAHLRRELAAFEACLAGDLTAPVEHCGDWTLYDLADHLGRGNLWAATACIENRGDHQAPTAPTGQSDLVSWFHDSSGVLLAAIDTDPATPAWTIFPPATVGFWQRRRCMETVVHRWDAEHALGFKASFDPVLADDGVAEVLDTMAPRQIKLGRLGAPRQAVRFTATDTGSSWVWGSGEPVAAIGATSSELLLMLWGRTTSTDEAMTWQGDRDAALAVLGGGLVP